MDQYRYVGDELDVFAHAVRWKAYIKSLIDHALTGDVLEVGAGIGTSTRAWRSRRQTTWTCLEPDPDLAETIARRTEEVALPIRVLRGTTSSLQAKERFNAVLYLDVLEHIEDDAAELNRAAVLLAPGGRLIGTESRTSMALYRLRRADWSLSSVYARLAGCDCAPRAPA